MSDTKKLLVGIVLVGIAIALILTASSNWLPWLGTILGLIGAILFVMTLVRGRV